MKPKSISRALILPAILLLEAALPIAPAEESEKQFKVSATAPATNYKLSISGVYQVKKEIWVISRVEQVGDFGGQALTQVSDAVTVKTSDLPKEKFTVIYKVAGRAIKESGANAINPEIKDLETRIMEMKRFAARARFTPEGYKEFKAKLSAMEKQLQGLQSQENKKNNVEYLSGDGEKKLEKTLATARKIPFIRKGKKSSPTRP
ncbi:MAG: hypothetical protein MK183_06315 [Verrucomicrobiales bacterium]|nr:hypothetical protein [Verrucomicrobiales bacterium]